MNEVPAYNLWGLVIINIAVFLIFAFSFTHPKTSRDWRSFGAFSAFIIALFTEMYGFPLTIYVLSGWLGNKYPSLNLYSHNAGHLWETLFGFSGDPHLSILHIISNILIFGGFIIIASAWDVLYKSQKDNTLASTGMYKYVRHPQYVGFIIIMLGFLLQWPTIPTLIMFPILIGVYINLAKREEKDSQKAFGQKYTEYVKNVPGFIPKLGK